MDGRGLDTDGTAARLGPAGQALLWCAGTAVRASLVVSPCPAALPVRKVFAAGGAKVARALAAHAPPGVSVLADQRYGDEDDMLVDIVRPASASGPLPLLVWVHGGGWVGGSKEELTSYFKLIASHGYAVAGPRYSLAPERHYPTPPRQLMQVLGYLQANAGRLRIDPDRVAIAGDSAGAQIAAQLGALVTHPVYARAVGISATVTATQLRGLVLARRPPAPGRPRVPVRPRHRASTVPSRIADSTLRRFRTADMNHR
jgi:acetyl esterase